MHRRLGLTIALLGLPGCFTDAGAVTGAVESAGSSTGTGTGTSGPAETGSSSGGGTTGSSSDTGVVPTTEPATTGPMDGDVCDPWLPMCPDGSKCAAYATDGGETWNANKCVPAGDGQPGIGCMVTGSATSGQDTCKAGAMCWDVDPDLLTGVCFALCGGSEKAPFCPPGSTCFRTNDGVVNLCVAECDPLIEKQCDGVCVFDTVGQQFICLLDASGETAVGDVCEFINACPPGSACDDPARSDACEQGTDGCCLEYCNLLAMDPCGPDMNCEPFLGDAPPPAGHDNVGLCVKPPP